ncbi:MAG TPA: murein transglycosylase [Cyanobacteria bacterium UBA8803]|nr:murein transglycosylase [Cyanobacteria bacterium UBA9273]HBL62102.1 murein transglycosylase [Cyanobacteria bacterium UBA8803]
MKILFPISLFLVSLPSLSPSSLSLATKGIGTQIPTTACLLVATSANPFLQDTSLHQNAPAKNRELLFRVWEAVSFKGCGLQNLGADDRLWGDLNQAADKQALLTAIDYSLRYLKTDKALAAYRRYSVTGITRDRVLRSLLRFRQLLLTSDSPTALEAAVKREFLFYQSNGKDGQSNILFTAYYEPIYAASRVPTAEYRYPLYRQPPNLSSWPKPHPTRKELEGEDGLQGGKGHLRGLALFWLRDRLEAYIAHIQGSARLVLPDGTQTSVNYDGNTAYSYTSIGRALADDGKLPLEGMTMPIILQYFREHPQELNNYIPRDRSFVFFQETHGAPALGSISVPLTAERSIATDKSLMPPGALALIRAPFPFVKATGELEHRTVSRYVLDQDTGGAIKGAGRVDYFLGTGKEAGDRAGVTVSEGQLYYLLLKGQGTLNRG